MRTVSRLAGESIEDFVRRVYTLRNSFGYESPKRLECAARAVHEANPRFEELREVHVPEIPRVPLLKHLIDDKEQLHKIVHAVLSRVQENPRLLALSFIDPIRLGIEELGIAATPEVVAEVRARLEGHVSFDQERYEEIRDQGLGLHGPTRIQWVPGGE